MGNENRQPNLLMLSGDRDVARGRAGPFQATLEGLAKHFARIDVLTPRSPAATPRRIHGNVFVHPAPDGRAKQPTFILNKAGELSAERRYALAVSHDFGLFYNGIGAMRVRARFGIPYVSEIHHVPGHPKPANFTERALKLLTRWYVQWARSEAQTFRAVNSVEMPGLLRDWGVPVDQIVVLPSAYLDLAVFNPRPPAESRWDVVFCGRLVPNKGLDLLAEAAAVIVTIRPQTRFLIIGEGPEGPKLQRRLDRAGILQSFTFAGWLDSPAAVAGAYRASRLLICTSYNEGGPRVCLEAMACGIPVVSTAVGIMPEVLQDGLNGRLVSWDAQEIAAAVLEVVDDSQTASRMGRLGLEAVRPFARENTLEAYALAYREMAESNLAKAAP